MKPFRLTVLVALVGATSALLAACNRSEVSGAPLPSIAAVVPASAPPAPAFSLATRGAGGAAAGASDGPNSQGAETSPSSSTGPSNMSAAVGGMGGGQSAGGTAGKAAAPTSGDGAAPPAAAGSR